MSGVMLGVLVLVVVMSVYSGLEREVKGRLLGFIPHVRLDYAPMGMMSEDVIEWRGIIAEVEALDGVEKADPFVQDSALIDIHGLRAPGMFRGIDTRDETSVAGIEAMLAYDEHPESTADMGLDDRVVISSRVARSFQARVGDTIRLLTLRNYEEVEAAFERTKRPPVREEFAENLQSIRDLVASDWRVGGDDSQLSAESFDLIAGYLWEIHDAGVRVVEEDIILEAMNYLAKAEKTQGESEGESVEIYRHEKSGPEQFMQILDQLKTTNVAEMDAEVLKGVEEIVLPKEAVIVGVYQSSQMAMTPDVFMPLHLAQDLTGLDGSVQAVSVRLDDPYQAGVMAEQLRRELPEGWVTQTWVDELRDFSRLIEQQRTMMYFALSFIILVSAFSMTAVMFTVTVQKRREIGVMKALGAAPGKIVRVFVYQGMILGAAGSVIGIGLGLLVIRLRAGIQGVMRQFGFDPFPASFNGFSVLPAHVNPVEVGVIGVAAFLLCMAAAYLPAMLAARSDAARSLRNL